MSKDLLRTALLIPVPEAEPIVGNWRARFDPSAEHGVPAHLTLVFPFLPAGRCAPHVVAELGELFASISPFPYQLTELRSFPGVLYLAPEPAEPFVCVVESLVKRYPDAPPYGGAFGSIVPHLTVAHSCDAAILGRITSDVGTRLPIQCRAQEVLLMRENIDGLWQIWIQFRLGHPATRV